MANIKARNQLGHRGTPPHTFPTTPTPELAVWTCEWAPSRTHLAACCRSKGSEAIFPSIEQDTYDMGSVLPQRPRIPNERAEIQKYAVIGWICGPVQSAPGASSCISGVGCFVFGLGFLFLVLLFGLWVSTFLFLVWGFLFLVLSLWFPEEFRKPGGHT